MSFRVVSNNQQKVVLKELYSIDEKISFWSAICASHEDFVEKFGSLSGRDAFLAFIDSHIFQLVEDGHEICFNDGKEVNTESLAISSKTLTNLLIADRSTVVGMATRTCQYCHLFVEAQKALSRPSNDNSTVRSATHLSKFYVGEEMELDAAVIQFFTQNDAYEIPRAAEMVINPIVPRRVVLAVQRNQESGIVEVRLIPSTVDFSERDKEARTEMLEEQFHGFDVPTVDGGLACLRGANSFAPLFVFFKDCEGEIGASVVSLSSPGYLQKYEKLSTIQDPNILKFLE